MVANRFYKYRLYSKTIVIRFLKVKNELVVFKNDRFFPKRNDRFRKRLKNETRNDRLTIVFKKND